MEGPISGIPGGGAYRQFSHIMAFLHFCLTQTLKNAIMVYDMPMTIICENCLMKRWCLVNHNKLWTFALSKDILYIKAFNNMSNQCNHDYKRTIIMTLSMNIIWSSRDVQIDSLILRAFFCCCKFDLSSSVYCKFLKMHFYLLWR